MAKEKSRNYSLNKKLLLFKDEFPGVPISRGTLYKIQKKYLRYSFKRITQYIPKLPKNIILKRIFFI